MKEQYTYAVARVRSKELALLTNQDVGRLLGFGTYGECVSFLNSKGWGFGDRDCDADEVLSKEMDKTWGFISEMVEDVSLFDVLLYPCDYNNLKACIKGTITGVDVSESLFVRGTIPSELILSCAKHGDFMPLPEHMRDAARQAFDLLLHTRDGQMCDAIIDKTLLRAIRNTGWQSDNSLIREYAEIFVACADIKIAVRSRGANKRMDFLQMSLEQCDTINVDLLLGAANKSLEAIYEYLSLTVYSDCVPMLKKSMTAFEKWCDDAIIQAIKREKYNSFSIGPLAAYILARENEIKVVRIILSAKINELDEVFVRERLREMYV